MEPLNPQWASKTVQAGGLTFHYLDTETHGPVLFCLHGTSMSSACWGHLATRLRPDFRVIALDMRGHGQSDRPDSSYSIAELAHDVAGVVQALGLAQVHLIGSSVGNQVAVTYAAAHPDRVAGLVLSDPSFYVSDTEIVKYLRSHHTRKRRYSTRAEAEAYCRSLPQRAGLSRDMNAMAMQGDFRRNPDGSYTWAYDLGAITKVFLGLSADQSDDIARVRAPVLILNADRSNVLGAEQAAKLTTDFADARLIMVPDSNHTIWGDQPEFLAARVREFLTAPPRG